MLAKLKDFFGLDDPWGDGQPTSSNNLIEVRALQAENRQLKAIIKQQDKIISLSQENKRLKREIRNMKQAKRRRK